MINESIISSQSNRQTGLTNKNLGRFKDCLKSVRHKLNEKKPIIFVSDPNFNYSILALSPLFVLGTTNLDHVDTIKNEDKNHFTDITKSLFFSL